MLPFVSKQSNFKNLFRLSLFVTIVILLSKFLNPFLGTLLVFLLTVFATSRLFLANENIQTYAVVAILFVGFTPFYLILRGFVTRSVLNGWDLQFYSILFFLSALLVKFFVGNKKSNLIENNFLPNQKKLFFAFGSLWVGLLTYLFLVSKSLGSAVAWAASGDNKNHLVNGVSIAKYGFLDPTTFYTQPVSSPSFLALVLSQGDQSWISNTLQLEFQMKVFAFVWILLIGVLGLTFASTLQIFWNKVFGNSFQIPKSLVFVFSCVPTFSYLLGSSLFDGFFTAIFGIATCVSIMNWFLSQGEVEKFSKGSLSLGFALLICSVMAWMFTLPLVVAVFVLGVRDNLLKKGISNIKIAIALLTLGIFAISAIHFSKIGQDLIKSSKLALNTPGAVNVNNPNYFYILLLTLIFLAIFIQTTSKSFGYSLLNIGLVHFVVLFLFKIYSNLDIFDWNYYLLKYQWIMFSAITPFAISSIFYLIYNSRSLTKCLKYLSFSILIIILFIFSESIVSANRVHQKILNGWDNPRAVTLNKMFEFEIDNNVPTLFFHFGYAGESRMANFWLNAFTNPVEPIKGWNYTIDTTGDPKQMCDVNFYYPKVRLVTSDVFLENNLLRLCPNEEFVIEVQKPLYQ